MKQERFSELLQSVKEAVAIRRGETKAPRVFRVEVKKRASRTRRAVEESR